MKSRISYLLLFLLGVFLFDLLFWHQKIGINFPIFSFLLLTISISLNKKVLQKKEVLYSLVAVFISGTMVVWNNTGWSVFMHFLSVFIAFGFIKQAQITTVFEGVLAFFISYFAAPFAWYKRLKSASKENRAIAFSFSFVKLCIIPLVVFFLFFIIYKNANPKFDELTLSFSKIVTDFLKNVQFSRVFFLLFGLSFLLLAFGKQLFQLGALASHEDSLFRQKKSYSRLAYQAGGSPFSDLLNEKKVGVLIFAVLNALLLFVNIIDINWMWFGFEVPLEFNLKQFVHEGTYLLIFSILLSMGIFLYFFRGSLNFYPKNKWLLLLGKAWILQNIVLTISVFLRNYHYISYHGLAGKRIGVVAFLVMTIFGLITLIIKVNKLKTSAFLLRKNGWFILFSMTLLCCLEWDRVIVNYNLAHENKGEIDVDYYLQLSPTVAPILFRNLDLVEGQMQAHINRKGKKIWLQYLDIQDFKEALEYRTSKYLQQQREYTWPSWNRADWQLLRKTELVSSE